MRGLRLHARSAVVDKDLDAARQLGTLQCLAGAATRDENGEQGEQGKGREVGRILLEIGGQGQRVLAELTEALLHGAFELDKQ